ncbi:MAG: hypothetical protein ABSG90_01995 [Dehalococcoidia bacterium]|jgi:hypothetical protein
MAVEKAKQKIVTAPEPWYCLNDDDILMVAEEMDLKLNKAQITKVKNRAPDYIDWFSAIESAIAEIRN